MLHSAYISGYAEKEALKVLLKDMRTIELILYDRIAYPEKRADELEPGSITASENLEPAVKAILETEEECTPGEPADNIEQELPSPEEDPVIPGREEFEKHIFP